MSLITNNIVKITGEIYNALSNISNSNPPTLVAVTKGRSAVEIEEAILAGITNFGENYLQEAIAKWIFLKGKYPNIKLHFIGGLQSNKLKKILNLFDVIQTIDSISLINYIIKIDNFKNKDFYIEVKADNNHINSSRKGVNIEGANDLICYANKNGLPIKGIMGIAPVMSNAEDNTIKEYFLKLKQLKDRFNLDNLSIGMSSDYMLAINSGSTMLRIGNKIFN